MTGKRDHLYFELLQEGVRYAVEAAAQLQNDLEHFDASVLNQQIDTMHELEHQADLTKHQAMEKLIREFITPLEREDILGLTSAKMCIRDRSYSWRAALNCCLNCSL